MRLLEARGETKTLRELRAMVAEIDVDNNHKVGVLAAVHGVDDTPSILAVYP